MRYTHQYQSGVNMCDEVSDSGIRVLLENADIYNYNPNAEPDVDVLMGTFNQVNFVRRAVKSVEEQRFPGSIRILVHDDASTDGTREALLELFHSTNMNMALILQRENMYNLNLSYRVPLLLNSRARFIANLDGDDYWVSTDKLSRQVESLEHQPQATLSYHPVDRVDINDNLLHEVGWPNVNSSCSWYRIVFRNPIASPSVLIRRSAIPSWLNELSGLDWTLWGAVLLGGPGIETKDLRARYRVSDRSQSTWDSRRINSAMLKDLHVLAQRSQRLLSLFWRYSRFARRLRITTSRIGTPIVGKLVYQIVSAPGLLAGEIGSGVTAIFQFTKGLSNRKSRQSD